MKNWKWSLGIHLALHLNPSNIVISCFESRINIFHKEQTNKNVNKIDQSQVPMYAVKKCNFMSETKK